MTEKRFENRVNKSNVKFNTLNPVWDNEKEDALNVFEMIDELNRLNSDCSNLIDDNTEFNREINQMYKENEQLKKELKKYTDAFDCSQCRFQNYDWFDDGDEFEVCEKGNNEAQMENHSCSEWEEI